MGEVFESLEKVDRRGIDVLSGKEDINGASSSVWPLDRPSGVFELTQSRSISSQRARMWLVFLPAHRDLEMPVQRILNISIQINSVVVSVVGYRKEGRMRKERNNRANRCKN